MPQFAEANPMARKRAVSSEDSTSRNGSLPAQAAKRIAKRNSKTERAARRKTIATAGPKRRRPSVETYRSTASTVLKGIIKPRKRSASSPAPSQKKVHFDLPSTSSEDRRHKKPRRESRSKERRHSSGRTHRSTSSSSSSSSGARKRRSDGRRHSLRHRRDGRFSNVKKRPTSPSSSSRNTKRYHRPPSSSSSSSSSRSSSSSSGRTRRYVKRLRRSKKR